MTVYSFQMAFLRIAMFFLFIHYYAFLMLNEWKMKVTDAESGFSIQRDTKKTCRFGGINSISPLFPPR